MATGTHALTHAAQHAEACSPDACHCEVTTCQQPHRASCRDQHRDHPSQTNSLDVNLSPPLTVLDCDGLHGIQRKLLQAQKRNSSVHAWV
jgi:hypothetical protein